MSESGHTVADMGFPKFLFPLKAYILSLATELTVVFL